MTPKRTAAVAGDQLPAKKGNCVLCAAVAERACQRCGDFYCSEECQRQDWQRHRYICFPLPALVYPKSFSMLKCEGTDQLSLEAVCSLDKPNTAVVESGSPILECDGAASKVGPGSSSADGAGAAPTNFPVTSAPIPHATNGFVSNYNTFNMGKRNISPPKAILPPSNSLVFISGFRSPNRCYIRDASKTADEAFVRMCEKVNAMGNEMPRMTTARTHGYCLALYNDKFQRASVINVTGKQTARVLLFDRGIVKSRNLSDMREVNDELLSLPTFSVQVQLKDVPSYVITDDVIKFLSRFEGGKYVAVYSKAPGAIIVELLDSQTKESLNLRIREFCMNLKLYESPYVGNKNQKEKEPPMKQKKPNQSQETTPLSNNKNSALAKIGIEMEIAAEIERSISIRDEECGKIEKDMVNETKETTNTDRHPHEKKLDCAQDLGESTKNIKPTPNKIEIENQNLSLEPKAGESLLQKDKDIQLKCEGTDQLSLEGVCSLDKPYTAVVESGSPILECDGAASKVGPGSSSADGAGAAPTNFPVTSAPIPHATNGFVSNYNTFNMGKRNISPPKAILPPSNSLVFISGFRSPNRCYIRDASKTADEAFVRMCEKVNAMGNEMPRMTTARTHGYCLALYNDKFQRASVINVTGKQTARVLLFDRGIVKSRNLSDMREVNDKLLSLPTFSVQVQLKDVPNYVITDDVIKFLSRFEGGKYVAVYSKAPGAIIVELLDSQTKESLNLRIREFCMNLKLYESPYVGNKNQKEKEPPMKQKKPNQSQETTPLSNNKNSALAKIGIEMEIAAEIERSISIRDEECGKIEKDMVNETKETTNTDRHPHEKKLDCAQDLGESTKNIKPTPNKIEIENQKLSLEPKAGESLLQKDKDIPAPLATSKDESVQEFQTQCLALKPTLQDVPASVPPKEKLDVETPVSQSKPQENGNVGPVLVPPFELRRFGIGNIEGIDVYVVDVTKIAVGIFGAFDRSFSSEFSTLHSRLSEITDTEPYKPVLKEFVLARYKGSWYRGRVEQIKNTPELTRYLVIYLDYSNTAYLTEWDIRRYPSDFTTPCSTNMCMFDGFPHNPSPAQVAYLSNAVKVHQLIHVDSVKYVSMENNIALVRSQSLIDKLMSL